MLYISQNEGILSRLNVLFGNLFLNIVSRCGFSNRLCVFCKISEEKIFLRNHSLTCDRIAAGRWWYIDWFAQESGCKSGYCLRCLDRDWVSLLVSYFSLSIILTEWKCLVAHSLHRSLDWWCLFYGQNFFWICSVQLLNLVLARWLFPLSELHQNTFSFFLLL